jgi:hypothetical protein
MEAFDRGVDFSDIRKLPYSPEKQKLYFLAYEVEEASDKYN